MTQTATQPASRAGEDVRFLRTQFDVVELPIAEDAAAPSTIKIAPWGTFDLRDKVAREQWGMPGSFDVGERSASEIPKNFERRDIDHSVNEQHDQGGRALGWLDSVEVVEGEGIFASIEWTAEGRSLIESKTYRYASGEWVLDISEWMLDDGPAFPVAITGIGLTNKPAVKGFQPLMTESLTDALSGLDGRDREGQPTPRTSGEKGECRMDGNFLKGLFSPIFGREPKDEADAATLAVEQKEIRENFDKLTADLEASTSMVSELTEKLDKANKTISEFEAAEADRAAAEKLAQVETAITEGRIAQSVAEAAKENPDKFLPAAELTEEGTFSPPKGRQVTDDAIDKAATTTLDGDVLDAEVRAYMTEHDGVPYHKAALAVKKQRETAGKEV